ncbi:MAG: thrombospondin type 3 repeat-containing protein [Longimicrobiales bacterium]|nr:thrombospondin type 3 repeat-containing protein [Longimicrobiales bacterium]
MKHRLTALVTLALVAACGEAPLEPTALMDVEPAFSHQDGHLLFTSGSHVDTWNAIVPSPQDPNWGTTVCVPQPAVRLNDPRWTNPHKAFVANGAAFRSWTSHIFYEDWINAWPGYEWYGLTTQYGGPPGSLQQSWTRYSTPVSGNGEFVLYLAADNCSWIYISDANGNNSQLVGVQLGAPWVVPITYPVTLSGNHRLDFIVFDGGGQSGGMFRLETNASITFSDRDGDGLADVTEQNVTQTDPDNPDTDGDGLNDGDEVAGGTNPNNPDTDGDGVPDGQDEFPLDPTRGNPDSDGDGVSDDADNCVAVANADQANNDGDGQGDACDADDDNDGTPDAADAFPTDPSESVDTDGDGTGNNADPDDDDDGVPDASDAFPTDPSESVDTDGDGTGNNADTDDDNDGVADGNDAFPLDRTESVDTDGDGTGNTADTDDDGDGYSDQDENDNGTNPLDAGSTPPDNDGDKVSDLNDPDDDNDGVNDADDAFPTDPSESVDSDHDGIGNNADAFDTSDTRSTLHIGTCSTGVGNRHLGNGTWWSDLIAAAKTSAKNHGAFVSAVAALTDGWKKAGLITGRQEGAITSCAAQSK